MTNVRAEILVSGRSGAGNALVLTAPISFWGGVSPATGLIADVRHPQHRMSIAGTVLCLPGTIGSSSASAVLLELVSRGLAPAAIILHEPDAILLLGLIVAREMSLETPQALKLDREVFAGWNGRALHIGVDGSIIDRPTPSS